MSALAAPSGATRAQDIDRRGIVALSLGHCCVDVTQGAVPALLPFLIAQRGYGYGAAAGLVLAMTACSSLLQPLFGYLADKRSLTWLLPGGVAVAAVGIALVGSVDGYAATFALVLVSGLGVGAYHPEGARWANYASGDRRATGMSIYSVGGNIGFALGPVMVTPLVLLIGLGATALVALPLLAVAALLARELPRLRAMHGETARRELAAAGSGEDRWGAFAALATTAALRSGVWLALQAFVPVWLVTQLGSSVGLGNTALTVTLVSGAIGTIVSGRVADRVGPRNVLLVCSAVVPLLIVALLLSADLVVAFPLLALIGFFTVATFGITVVVGQEHLPSRIGIASGVTLGAAIGAGGVIAWLLGLLADAIGLTPALLASAALPLAAFALTLTLPRDRGR